MAQGKNIKKGRSYFSYSEVVEDPTTPFTNNSINSESILVINEEILELTKRDFIYFIKKIDKKESDLEKKGA